MTSLESIVRANSNCTICLSSPAGFVYTCDSGGHVVCEKCMLKCKKEVHDGLRIPFCHTCVKPTKWIRNMPLERILDEAFGGNPCPYSFHNMSPRMMSTLMHQHLIICVFRPGRCPVCMDWVQMEEYESHMAEHRTSSHLSSQLLHFDGDVGKFFGEFCTVNGVRRSMTVMGFTSSKSNAPVGTFFLIRYAPPQPPQAGTSRAELQGRLVYCWIVGPNDDDALKRSSFGIKIVNKGSYIDARAGGKLDLSNLPLKVVRARSINITWEDIIKGEDFITVEVNLAPGHPICNDPRCEDSMKISVKCKGQNPEIDLYIHPI